MQFLVQFVVDFRARFSCQNEPPVAKKRVSIKDIAQLAGVSHPTVSRALRGEGRMAEETRTRIRAIAREMGYTPSMIARGLVSQRSYTVGLVINNLADPFNSEVAEGLEHEALRNNYSILLATATLNPQREFEVVRHFQSRQVDGIIVASSMVGNPYAELLQETGIPIVLINTQADGDNMHAVLHDDYGGMCKVVQHLIERGYRRIAHIGNADGSKTLIERRQAWSDTLLAAGLEPELFVIGKNGRFDGGVEAAEKLLPAADQLWGAPPDAICCYNDTMATGALTVLHNRGHHIPDEIAITGFDDVEFAAYLEPPLTTLRQPRRQMGETAMRLILELIGAPDPAARREQTILPGELIVRRSTGGDK